MKLRHIGVAVDSIERAQSFYVGFLGLSLVGGPYDDPIQRVRVAFYSSTNFSNVEIELIEPLTQDSPVAKLLSNGSRSSAYHICVSVSDIETAIEDIRKSGGLVLANPVPAVAFGGRKIAWVYTKTKHLMELLEE